MKRKEILKTDKPRHKLRLRPAVNVLRCVILFDHTAVHNSYLIWDGEALLLVMGDEQSGDSQLLLNPFDLHSHIDAQLGI